jgi:hypothetical protein
MLRQDANQETSMNPGLTPVLALEPPSRMDLAVILERHAFVRSEPVVCGELSDLGVKGEWGSHESE